MEQIIIGTIENAIAGASVRCFETTGGWVIEVISPNFADDVESERAVVQALHNIPQGNPVVIVWKILVYTNENESFTVSGTLHTRESQWDNEGIETTFLSADDCYLNLSEFDGEILQLGSYNGRELEALVAMHDSGVPMLPYNKHAHYVWLETLGGRYYLTDENPTEIENNRITIRLRGQE